MMLDRTSISSNGQAFPLLAPVLTLALALLPMLAAHAQQEGGIVTLGAASGAPGNTVTVAFEFDNTEGAEVLEARARIQGIDAFSQVDVSEMCDSSAAFIVGCQLNDTNRIVVVAANQTGTPIDSFSGSIAFTIDAAAPGDTDVMLEWNAPEDDDQLFTPSKAIDGLVSVVTDGPQISLDPGSLDFGELRVGQASAPQTIQATNSGNADGLEIDGVATDSADFAIDNNGCEQAVLAQGEFCPIDIVFAPTTDSVRTGALSIATNVGTTFADLTGLGTAPRLTVDPESGTLDFGIVAPGASTSIGGQFTNDGTAPLDVSCTLPPDEDEFQTQPDPLNFTNIQPGSSVQFTLVFAPETGVEQSALLACESNAIDLPDFDYLLTAPGIFIFTDRFET